MSPSSQTQIAPEGVKLAEQKKSAATAPEPVTWLNWLFIPCGFGGVVGRVEEKKPYRASEPVAGFQKPESS